MYYKLIVCILFAGIYFSSSSQDYVMDSLLLKEQKGMWESDSIKVDGLVELAFQFLVFEVDFDKAQYYADRALKLAESIKYEKGIGNAYMRIGSVAENKGKLDTAIVYLDKAIKIKEKVDSKIRLASAYNSLAIVYEKKGKLDKARSILIEGINKIDNESSSLLAKMLINLGGIEKDAGNHTAAFTAIDKSYEIALALNDVLLMAQAKLNLANTYLSIENLIEAKKNYLEVIDLCKSIGGYPFLEASSYNGLGSIEQKNGTPTEAIKNYLQALEHKTALSVTDQMAIQYNIGTVYEKLKEYDKARTYFLKYLDYQKEKDNSNEVALALLNIGHTYLKEENYADALDYFEKSLTHINSNSSLELRSEINRNLFHTHLALDNSKAAYEYLTQAEMLLDSLNNQQIEAANYKTNYEIAKAEKEQLQNQLALETSEKQKQQIITAAISIASLLLLILLSMIFRSYYQKQKRRQAEQEVDTLLAEAELGTTYARLEGQDMERKRIAQDLHDGLGSLLSTIKLHFTTIEEKMDVLLKDKQEPYYQASNLLDKAVDEVRRVAYDMKSGTLMKFGLEAELKSMVDTIQSSKKIEVELTTHQMNERIDDKVESQLYRIVQELVSNILKHAKAEKISIELNRFDDMINLVVEDDGVGFDLEKIKDRKGGIGIAGIQARVHELKGTIDYDSKIGRGTSVTIDIPYQN